MKDYLALLDTFSEKWLKSGCVNRVKDFMQFTQLPHSTEKSEFEDADASAETQMIRQAEAFTRFTQSPIGAEKIDCRQPGGEPVATAASQDKSFTQFAQLPSSAKKVNLHAAGGFAKPDAGPVAVTVEAPANDAPVRTEMAVGKAAIQGSVPAHAVEWRPLADAYYRHHFGCLQCIAAGQNEHLNRCSVGRPLWVAYRTAIHKTQKGKCDD